MEDNKSNIKQREPNGEFAKGNTLGVYFPQNNDLRSKYKPEYDDDIVKWFNDMANNSLDYPTFERYARGIGVLATTLRYWAENNVDNKYGRFDIAYRTCKEIQAEVLAVRTLGKAYEPSFAKFLAVNNLGMVDQSAVKLQGDAEQPLKVSIEIVD